MIGAKIFRDAPRMVRFVKRRDIEADGERFNVFRRTQLGHERDDGTGIDSAAEKDAERNVADQTQANRFFEPFA